MHWHRERQEEADDCETRHQTGENRNHDLPKGAGAPSCRPLRLNGSCTMQLNTARLHRRSGPDKYGAVFNGRSPHARRMPARVHPW